MNELQQRYDALFAVMRRPKPRPELNFTFARSLYAEFGPAIRAHVGISLPAQDVIESPSFKTAYIKPSALLSSRFRTPVARVCTPQSPMISESRKLPWVKRKRSSQETAFIIKNAPRTTSTHLSANQPSEEQLKDIAYVLENATLLQLLTDVQLDFNAVFIDAELHAATISALERGFNALHASARLN